VGRGRQRSSHTASPGADEEAARPSAPERPARPLDLPRAARGKLHDRPAASGADHVQIIGCQARELEVASRAGPRAVSLTACHMRVGCDRRHSGRHRCGSRRGGAGRHPCGEVGIAAPAPCPCQGSERHQPPEGDQVGYRGDQRPARDTADRVGRERIRPLLRRRHDGGGERRRRERDHHDGREAASERPERRPCHRGGRISRTYLPVSGGICKLYGEAAAPPRSGGATERACG
jgi:hypothetical protein